MTTTEVGGLIFIDSILNRTLDESNEKQRSKEINLNTIPGAQLKHVQFAVEKYEAIRTLWPPDWGSCATAVASVLMFDEDELNPLNPSIYQLYQQSLF